MKRTTAFTLLAVSLSVPFPPVLLAAEDTGVAVVAAPAERKPISNAQEFVGRIDAPEKVSIRARVKGVLEEVLFREGDTIKAGTPLYRIEKALFNADVEQAQGTLERTQAELTLASIQRQRAQQLLERNAGTAVAFDQAVAQEAQAKAATTSAGANLDTAKINLGYTDITAPIDGRIGRTAVSKGNVIGPDSGELTTMVSQDPMYVTFPVSQRDIMAAQKANKVNDPKSIKLRIRFSDGTLYDQIGQISFVDVSVDRSTDTLIVRGDIANPGKTLVDGQLVKVELEAGKPEERVVVPQAALIADQQGVYVFIVEDGKAAIRRLKTAGSSGPNVVVSSGLDGGELVVTDGFQSLRPGIAVRASPPPALNTGG
ncbi:efflux RND transporter periplasmic adaptor subunit [Labrys okinawensis]|uniref:efflux RND transporter periplasmic adaptor subunit n=1 Tax=Labrys okinawensis TaxID=346911 RepID=UPI0039BD6BBD